jgi:hypothetical protein
MSDDPKPANPTTDAHEQLWNSVETIERELDAVERLAEDRELPAVERNASHLRDLLRTLELNLPPRADSGDD